MSENLTKLQEWALKNNKSIILELNDYLNANLDLEEEIEELLEDGDISTMTADRMMAHKCVWSVRYHPTPDSVVIKYSHDLETAVVKMCVDLEL